MHNLSYFCHDTCILNSLMAEPNVHLASWEDWRIGSVFKIIWCFYGNQCLVPSTHMVAVFYHASLRGLNTLFWPSQASGMQVVYIHTCRQDTHKTKANDYLKDKKASWRKLPTSLLRSRCLVPAIRVTLLLTLWNTQQERCSPKTVHKLQISFRSSHLNRTVNSQIKTRLHFLRAQVSIFKFKIIIIYLFYYMIYF